ncbi:DUF5668 domain-containing protein [Candidatus Parcubacteria bacterium]|nr:DUF5668 domain-containing protein [Candidatus Parcubacteria bacterium]
MEKMCNCHHHKVFPVLVVLFGLLFLLQALNVVSWQFTMMAWPVLVIAGGVMKFVGKSGMCKCC